MQYLVFRKDAQLWILKDVSDSKDKRESFREWDVKAVGAKLWFYAGYLTLCGFSL